MHVNDEIKKDTDGDGDHCDGNITCPDKSIRMRPLWERIIYVYQSSR